jgi:hypothetical protein
MVLVLRPSHQKVISVSRKRVHCHELGYAKFDPTSQARPLVTFTDFTLVESKIDEAIEEAQAKDKKTLKKFEVDHHIPAHVPSVKCLSDFNRNSHLNEIPIVSQLPSDMTVDLPQESPLGEDGALLPDLFGNRSNKDNLLEEIKAWKRKMTRTGHNDTIRLRKR